MCVGVSDFCQHAPALIHEVKIGMAALQSRQLKPWVVAAAPLRPLAPSLAGSNYLFHEEGRGTGLL